MAAEANPDLLMGLKEILIYTRLTEARFRDLYNHYNLKGATKVSGMWIGHKKQLDQYLQALSVTRTQVIPPDEFGKEEQDVS